ncbi:hypothetical protein VTK73DRAFT_4614 [Phialemonium thermophilum]|uniref:Alpha-1,3-mannosyltransferase CMT1 n=1 Tax=Phialemonium thermophilum TaxID=223376 RepID=A0ABR3WSS1_9PEZI
MARLLLQRHRLAIHIVFASVCLSALCFLLRHDGFGELTSRWPLPPSKTVWGTSTQSQSNPGPPVLDGLTEHHDDATTTQSDLEDAEGQTQVVDSEDGQRASPLVAELKLPTHELNTKARILALSVLNPADASVDRLACPAVNQTRYAYLKAGRPSGEGQDSGDEIRYFFALNLRQCVDLLPRLMGSVIEAMRFLGTRHCALSIVEGNSDDGTFEVLELLQGELRRLGVLHYYLRRSEMDPSVGFRIEKLAILRALAVEPVTGSKTRNDFDEDAEGRDRPEAAAPGQEVPKLTLAANATVVFLNDVAACTEDVLELIHQRLAQDADMTCGMDWGYVWDPSSPTSSRAAFYDVWVARALNGDTFFDIPPATVSWDRSSDLFFNEPVARSRMAAMRPFQVFSCWNGGVAFAAAPLADGAVRFRSSARDECFQGEPQLFCKDMWAAGHGRIAVVPTVNFAYTDGEGRTIKAEKGYVSEWVPSEANIVGDEDGEPLPPLRIPWQQKPPPMVKCMPMFTLQSWLPWNEGLPL